VSLRGEPYERVADLPDGRQARVRVAVPDDSYIPKRLSETVALEVSIGDEVVELLESGRVEPTASALERYADSLP